MGLPGAAAPLLRRAAARSSGGGASFYIVADWGTTLFRRRGVDGLGRPGGGSLYLLRIRRAAGSGVSILLSDGGFLLSIVSSRKTGFT